MGLSTIRVNIMLFGHGTGGEPWKIKKIMQDRWSQCHQCYRQRIILCIPRLSTTCQILSLLSPLMLARVMGCRYCPFCREGSQGKDLKNDLSHGWQVCIWVPSLKGHNESQVSVLKWWSPSSVSDTRSVNLSPVIVQLCGSRRSVRICTSKRLSLHLE